MNIKWAVQILPSSSMVRGISETISKDSEPQGVFVSESDLEMLDIPPDSSRDRATAAWARSWTLLAGRPRISSSSCTEKNHDKRTKLTQWCDRDAKGLLG